MPGLTSQKLITLVDGTKSPSDSEAWRHECEARMVAARPTLAERREYLFEVERRRGKDAADSLRRTMKQLWEARKT